CNSERACCRRPKHARRLPMSLRLHVLALATVASVIAVSSALAGRSDTILTVTSSLDGKTVLPLRSHWIAFAKDAQSIDHVDFFIDGYHAWTEHAVGTEQAGLYFGGRGNWLIPTFLKPGVHKFVVRAYDVANQMAVDTVQARVVAPPAPPAKLAGSWQRTTPSGTLLIAKNGWTIHPNAFVDARYLAN